MWTIVEEYRGEEATTHIESADALITYFEKEYKLGKSESLSAFIRTCLSGEYFDPWFFFKDYGGGGAVYVHVYYE